MRIALAFSGLLAISCLLQAQAPAGALFDNYGTFPAAYQQPAAGLNSPYHWEVELGGQANFENNYVFIRWAAGFWLLNRVRSANVLGVVSGTQKWIVGSKVYDFDYFDDDASRFLRFEGSISGPAISFRLGANWRIGAFHRIRLVGDARDVDNQFSFDDYDQLPEGDRIQVQSSSLQGAAWQEAGLNLARSFATDGGQVGIGINARYINPLSGAQLITSGQTTVTKINRGSVGLEDADVQLGLSGDLLTNNPGAAPGYGWGLDVGFTYSHGYVSRGSNKPLWTFGAALLDIGQITFNNSAETHRFASEADRTLVGENYEFAGDGLEQLPQVLDQLNRDFYPASAPNSSLIGSSFQIGLPTRASLSFSYQATEELGFDARVLVGVPIMANSLRGGQVASVNMRYTKWWYGAGASLHLHEFQRPNLGLYVRVGPLYFGSDRVVDTLIGRSQLAAGDFYAGLRFHAFKEKAVRNPKRSRSRYNECYKF